MKSANCIFVKCEPNNFWAASSNSGNLRVVSYNSTNLWIASCELIIRLWEGSCICLHYIKSALSVYIISRLHVKQTESNKELWYIPVMIYTWEQLWDLVRFKWKWIRNCYLQILENSQESNHGRILFQYSYIPCNFIKTGPHHGCFRENFPKF